MNIKNYRDHHDEIVDKISNIIEHIFDENTLVLYDIRSSIISSVLPHIPYVATYDQRIISMLHHATLICSEPFDRSVLDHYQSIGLCQKAEIITLPHQSHHTLISQILADEKLCNDLKSRKFTKIITFLPTEETELLSKKLNIPLLNSYQISQQSNDKVALKEYTISAWLNYLPWVITEDIQVMKKYFESSQSYFFKLAHWVSGFWFFDNKKDTLDSTIDTCKWQKIIIEEKIDLLDSPSVQFYCSQDEIIIIWVTDQILEDWRYYNWNMYPSQWSNGALEDSILQISKSVLKYIHGLWFRWFGGIDLMISNDKKVYVAEVNARFTWVTPALIINILLKKKLTNQRKFLLLDNHSYEEFSSQDKEERFPICIWWIKEWGKAQYLEWL